MDAIDGLVLLLILGGAAYLAYAGTALYQSYRQRQFNEMEPCLQPRHEPEADEPMTEFTEFYEPGQRAPSKLETVVFPVETPFEAQCRAKAIADLQLVNGQVEEVISGRAHKATMEEDAAKAEDEEFYRLAQKQAESNDPSVYGRLEQLKPDTDYEFKDIDAPGVWDLAREYQRLDPADLNAHLAALCIVLKYFPMPEQYVKDPFYYQFLEMTKQRELKKDDGDGKLAEAIRTKDDRNSGALKAIQDLVKVLEADAKKKARKPRKSKRKRARK